MSQKFPRLILSQEVVPLFSLNETKNVSVEDGSLKSLNREWLTTKEAAEYLRVPVGSLRNMTSNGKIPYYKLPGTRSNRYLLSDLRELLLSEKRGSHGI